MITAKRLIVSFLLVTLSMIPAAAQSKSVQIEKMLSKYHSLGHLEGSVLVAEEGKVILKKGYGLANREWNSPNAPDTRYDVGSLTKSFTAVLTMSLVEKGLIDLNAKVSDYLPNYRKDTGAKVRIHHLLSHTSGLPPFWTREFIRTHGRNDFEKEDLTKRFMSGDLQFEPGAESQYSDTNYFLLGRIIEKVTGKTYREANKELLFKPLGMKSSGYLDYRRVIPKLASGYVRSRKGVSNGPFNNRNITDSAGASYTTVEDLFVFDQALYSDRVISKSSRDELFKAHSAGRLGPRSINFGYGFLVGEIDVGGKKVLLIEAGGNNRGFTAIIYRLPERRRFVAILTNTGPDFFNERVHQIARDVLKILFEVPYEMPKASIAGVLGITIDNEGIEGALKRFKQLKAQGTHSISERELNGLGYSLLRQRKIPEAIEIFKLNVSEFPRSFNVYDSLAEAYMASGNKQLAIKNFAKSLELNPDNQNAVRQIETLRKTN